MTALNVIAHVSSVISVDLYVLLSCFSCCKACDFQTLSKVFSILCMCTVISLTPPPLVPINDITLEGEGGGSQYVTQEP